MERNGLFTLVRIVSCTAWFDCLFKFQVDQAVGYCSHFCESGCWSLYLLLWARLLVTLPIILDQAAGYCFHHFGSGFWLLFPLFWIRLLVTVPIILNQAVGHCSYYFGSGC
jgi:hypothetical protein